MAEHNGGWDIPCKFNINEWEQGRRQGHITGNWKAFLELQKEQIIFQSENKRDSREKW